MLSRYLGLSYAEYLDLPEPVTEAAIRMIEKENEERRKAMSGKWTKGRIVQPETPEIEPGKQARVVGVDKKTGYEIVERRREDGTVVRHRKVEPGEMILWAIAGKKPRSFENK